MKKIVVEALACAVLLAFAFTACSKQEAAGSGNSGSGPGVAGEYSDAPSLQGKGLPPVKDRLPENPLVVEPIYEVGKYGGEISDGFLGPADYATNIYTYINEPLVKWDRAGTGIIPNVAESWTLENEGRTYVFKLRKGMKWSDGQPFTSEDIMFSWEDIHKNPSVIPSVPKWLTTKGNPAVFEAPDQYTLKVTFDAPNATFLQNIAFMGDMPGQGNPRLLLPKHYLKKFHPKYTDQAVVDKEAKDLGFQTWNQAMLQMIMPTFNPDLPVLAAWKASNMLTGTNMQTYDRNPYYYKVDPDKKQLPYVDRLQFHVVENTEALITKIMSGEFNIDAGHITLPNYPMLKQSETVGKYKTLLWDKATGAQLGMWLNITHNDPVMRKIFADREFREALSYAINRKQISDICFMGLAVPRNATVMEACPYYSPGIDKLYADYDTAKANQLLDKFLPQKGSDGFRLRPDGKPFAIRLEFPVYNEAGSFEDMLELVRQDWAKVGVNFILKVIDRGLYEQRVMTNDMDMIVWTHGRDMHPLIAPTFIFPFQPGKFSGSHPYNLWYSTGGAQGEKPFGDVLKAMQTYDEFLETADSAKQLELGKEVVRISAENAWCIGTVGGAPSVVVRGENVGNFPEKAQHEWVLLQFAHVSPEQFYIK
jgi:peptide/nickel transport system substrate-binding protein